MWAKYNIYFHLFSILIFKLFLTWACHSDISTLKVTLSMFCTDLWSCRHFYSAKIVTVYDGKILHTNWCFTIVLSSSDWTIKIWFSKWEIICPMEEQTSNLFQLLLLFFSTAFSSIHFLLWYTHLTGRVWFFMQA